MGEAARQECSEGQGRALDEEERRELLRLQEPPRRGQGAQADPQMGCDGRSRARQSEAGRCARSVQHRQGGLGGQRLPLGRDRGRPEVTFLISEEWYFSTPMTTAYALGTEDPLWENGVARQVMISTLGATAICSPHVPALSTPDRQQGGGDRRRPVRP